MFNGRLGGYAYSANCGWISLSNAIAYVQTDAIAPGEDTNVDGIPDAGKSNFGTIAIDPNADPDGDKVSNLSEYYAGTNPNDGNDYLRITSLLTEILLRISPPSNGPPSQRVITRFSIASAWTRYPWADSIGAGFGGNSAIFNTGHTNAYEFYRIRAYRPLDPKYESSTHINSPRFC